MCSRIVSLKTNNKLLLSFMFLINQGYQMTLLSNPNCCSSRTYDKCSLLEIKLARGWKQRSKQVLHQAYKEQTLVKKEVYKRKISTSYEVEVAAHISHCRSNLASCTQAQETARAAPWVQGHCQGPNLLLLMQRIQKEHRARRLHRGKTSEVKLAVLSFPPLPHHF